MAIHYFLARLIRDQSLLISVSLSCALLRPVNALDAGADFFEAQQAQACQVYTVIESPIFISTFIPSNTVLSIPECECEVTVTNAPTTLSTTVIASTTLEQDNLSTPSSTSFSIPFSSQRYHAGTSISNNNPTFYITIDDTQTHKRESHHNKKYLKDDGSLTFDPSQAVQIYESSGRLFTIGGAGNGTYFTDVNVGSMTFASNPQSCLKWKSIAGLFSLGSNLVWEHKLFNNTRAIFGLSADGLVQAIFDGGVPAGCKVIGLVLRRVGSKHAVSSISSSSGGETIAVSSTILGGDSITTGGIIIGLPAASTIASQSLLTTSADESIVITPPENAPTSPTNGAASFIPTDESSIASIPDNVSTSLTPEAASSTILANQATSTILPSPTSISAITEAPSATSSPGADYTSSLSSFPTIAPYLISTSQITEVPSPTNTIEQPCTPTIIPPSSIPSTIGLASLTTPPNSSTLYTSGNTTFSLHFTHTNAGALATAQLNPTYPHPSSLFYYALNPLTTNATTTCESWGYLYHANSGLCLTGITPSFPSPALYQGANIALEPCMVCAEQPGLPESGQLFCAVQQEVGTLDGWLCMGFMGDDAGGVGYGVLYQMGVQEAVLEEAGGDCIYVASF